MEDLTHKAVEEAMEAGAGYADARFVNQEREEVSVKNGSVEALSSSSSRGIGVRVIADGAWGFASTANLDLDSIAGSAQLAVRIAKASATAIKKPVELAPVAPAQERVEASAKQNPFAVPVTDKIELLMECDARMAEAAGVRVREGFVVNVREAKHFASSEGADILQERIETGAGLQATAVGDGVEPQRRSYPGSHGGQMMARGWEVVEELDLPDNAARIAREAEQLLKAPRCPAGEMDIILEGSQLALQLHESCGHPIELDRVLGTEASFAGTSFLTPDKLGSFQYGSECVNITADATTPGGLGSFAYDDEGVPGQCVPIVENGIFKGYLSSRETAAELGISSGGAMRADGYNRIPLIRMTNINLLPGDWTLEEMIADTEEGLLLCTNTSWSIDDKRLNFQFGCEVAYEIRKGQLGRMLREPTYTGITSEFWGSCDAIAGEDEWVVWGVPNCGKGEPMQTARVAHGVAPARFRKVRVGVTAE